MHVLFAVYSLIQIIQLPQLTQSTTSADISLQATPVCSNGAIGASIPSPLTEASAVQYFEDGVKCLNAAGRGGTVTYENIASRLQTKAQICIGSQCYFTNDPDYVTQIKHQYAAMHAINIHYDITIRSDNSFQAVGTRTYKMDVDLSGQAPAAVCSKFTQGYEFAQNYDTIIEFDGITKDLITLKSYKNSIGTGEIFEALACLNSYLNQKNNNIYDNNYNNNYNNLLKFEISQNVLLHYIILGALILITIFIIIFCIYAINKIGGIPQTNSYQHKKVKFDSDVSDRALIV